MPTLLWLTVLLHDLKNGKSVEVRLVEPGDNEKLFEYFDQHFSKESKSRFGPQALIGKLLIPFAKIQN